MTKYDTDTLKNVKFAPHGNIKLLSFENSIKVFEATGPFNLELFNAYKHYEIETLTPKNKYCNLIIFKKSCLIHCEILSELHRFAKQKESHHTLPLAIAFVISKEVEGSTLMVEKYKKIYANLALEFNVFDTELEARNRLSHYL